MRLFLTSVFLIMTNISLLAQTIEHHIVFEISSRSELDSLSKIISIDKVIDNQVWAYANNEELAQFKLVKPKFEFCEPEASKATYAMATTIAQMADWNRYPTYNVYDSMMRQYATTFPNICQLTELVTLESGRQLLALKISSQVSQTTTNKPEIFCSANIHGNECVCMVTTLRLCDYLLNNQSDLFVKRLLDSTEIWILPLVNPDGMYQNDNSTIDGATRYNANSYDLNRNFPYINGTSKKVRQLETQAMIDFYAAHHFSLALCIHAGDECFNYPWDTWSRLTADDAWWQMVGGNYRDTAQAYGASGYFDNGCGHSANGLTNGYAWYSVDGGEQDYVNYFEHCRMATIELSNTKMPSGDNLPNYWNYNKNALLNFFAESLNGVRGRVTDVNGNPILAQITIDEHDTDNSWIETDARGGDYHRYLKAGTYNLTFSADGFLSKTIDSVLVIDGKPTWLDVVLDTIVPDSLVIEINVDTTATAQVVLQNTNDTTITFTVKTDTANWLTIDKIEPKIVVSKTDTITLSINTDDLQCGEYLAQYQFKTTNLVIVVNVCVVVKDKTANVDTSTVENSNVGESENKEQSSENGNTENNDNKTFVDDEQATEANIYSFGNTIIVENAQSEIAVYDIFGRLVCKNSTLNNYLKLPINNAGLYIVKVGNKTQRIFVNF